LHVAPWRNTRAQFVQFYEAVTGRTCPVPDPLSLGPDLREFVT
jgi:hypothetical protein